MMGGLGSGRPSGGGRIQVEACRTLDVNALRRDGVLVEGWIGTRLWTCNGAEVARIGIRGGADRIVLSYRWQQGGGASHDVEEAVRILWHSCRYGGRRPYFQCPGVVDGVICGRRVAKLYAAGRYFLCRSCYRLTYASRSEHAGDRALRRANRIKVRLGGAPGLDQCFPRRPKGTWHRTYERLMEDVVEAEARHAEGFAAVVARLEQRAGRFTRNGRRRRRFWR